MLQTPKGKKHCRHFRRSDGQVHFKPAETVNKATVCCLALDDCPVFSRASHHLDVPMLSNVFIIVSPTLSTQHQPSWEHRDNIVGFSFMVRESELCRNFDFKFFEAKTVFMLSKHLTSRYGKSWHSSWVPFFSFSCFMTSIKLFFSVHDETLDQLISVNIDIRKSYPLSGVKS